MKQRLKANWAGWAGSMQEERSFLQELFLTSLFPGQVGQVPQKSKPAQENAEPAQVRNDGA